MSLSSLSLTIALKLNYQHQVLMRFIFQSFAYCKIFQDYCKIYDTLITKYCVIYMCTIVDYHCRFAT